MCACFNIDSQNTTKSMIGKNKIVERFFLRIVLSQYYMKNPEFFSGIFDQGLGDKWYKCDVSFYEYTIKTS